MHNTQHAARITRTRTYVEAPRLRKSPLVPAIPRNNLWIIYLTCVDAIFDSPQGPRKTRGLRLRIGRDLPAPDLVVGIAGNAFDHQLAFPEATTAARIERHAEPLLELTLAVHPTG